MKYTEGKKVQTLGRKMLMLGWAVVGICIGLLVGLWLATYALQQGAFGVSLVQRDDMYDLTPPTLLYVAHKDTFSNYSGLMHTYSGAQLQMSVDNAYLQWGQGESY